MHIPTFVEGRKSEKQMLQLNKTKKAKAQELKVLVNAITKVRDTDEDQIKQKVENRYARNFCRNYSMTLKDNFILPFRHLKNFIVKSFLLYS